jgi:hypothetical protein
VTVRFRISSVNSLLPQLTKPESDLLDSPAGIPTQQTLQQVQKMGKHKKWLAFG